MAHQPGCSVPQNTRMSSVHRGGSDVDDVQLAGGGSGTRRAGGTRRTTCLGQDDRARRPARRGDVRGDVRLPDHHGSQPQPRHLDERDRDDLLPADRQGRGAQLSRHLRVVRRRRHGHLHLLRQRRAGWSVRRDRRDPGLGRRARAGRCAGPLRRRRHRQPDPAPGRDRRRGDGDRFQPGGCGHQHLHAGRPLDGDHHDDRRRPDGGGSAWLLRPDRDLPRPDLRLPALVDLRRDRGRRCRR